MVYSEFLRGKPVKPTASIGFMERAMGIETNSETWEINFFLTYFLTHSSSL